MNYEEKKAVANVIMTTTLFTGLAYTICALGDGDATPLEILYKYPEVIGYGAISGYMFGCMNNQLP